MTRKKTKTRKKRQVKKKEKLLLTPTEAQKVRFAVVLVSAFLAAFSLATGALQAGQQNQGDWHLSAFDTQGQCRMRILLWGEKSPSFKLFNSQGKSLL